MKQICLPEKFSDKMSESTKFHQDKSNTNYPTVSINYLTVSIVTTKVFQKYWESHGAVCTYLCEHRIAHTKISDFPTVHVCRCNQKIMLLQVLQLYYAKCNLLGVAQYFFAAILSLTMSQCLCASMMNYVHCL